MNYSTTKLELLILYGHVYVCNTSTSVRTYTMHNVFIMPEKQYTVVSNGLIHEINVQNILCNCVSTVVCYCYSIVTSPWPRLICLGH